jgi:hypothetical protein
MRRLLTGYAVSYNKRHKRHGQLFQNRYKSIICQEDVYFKELVRYIHLNPLRAKIVDDMKELDHYDYCGHSALIGKKKRKWQDVVYVLSYFGKSVGKARKGYISYVKEGIGLGRRPELVGGGLIRSLGGWDKVKEMRLNRNERIKSDQRILGESDFVLEVLSESEEAFSRKYKLKSKGYDFDKAADRVCELYKIEKDYIIEKGRQKKRVQARDLLCYWAVAELGISMVDLARKFDFTPAAVSYAVQRGEKIARGNVYSLEK